MPVGALYYTRDVEPEMTRRLREAVYGLGDEPLIRELERAVLPLRQLATGSDQKASGEKSLPHVEKMLARLKELDAALTEKAGRSRFWLFRITR